MNTKKKSPSHAVRLVPAGLAVAALALIAPLAAATSAPASDIPLPPANDGFSYQLYGAYTPEETGGLVSRDRSDAPAGDGYYDVCYVNVLQTQPDEEGQDPDNPPYGTTQWWIDNHPDLLLKDASGEVIIDEDWDEALFDVRTAAQREDLLAIQSEWFDGCAEDGFQAVEPDNLDSFLRSTGLISFAQTKEYMKLVVPYVHDLDLAIAQKNTSETGDGYGGIGTDFVDTVSPAQGFDFAIAEECAAYTECDTYTDLYGSLVFEVEYIGEDNVPVEHEGESGKSTPFEWVCGQDGDERSIILRDRDLLPSDEPGYHYEAC